MRIAALVILALLPVGQSTVFTPPVRCQPPTVLERFPGLGQPEAHPRSSGADVWALLFNAPKPASLTKIAWHVTGTGHFSAMAYSPTGTMVSPDWTEPHGRSNWTRPGDEWGTGFTFPTAGCWDVHITREAAFADFWLSVPSS